MGQYMTREPRDIRPAFVSLGMIVLDELRFPHRSTLYNVPGGSGLYATFGARLLKAGPHAVEVGCIVVAGLDFPESVHCLLKLWAMSLFVEFIPDKPSGRGLLQYGDNAFGRKAFTYITPTLQPSVGQLDPSSLLRAKSFHFLALPGDLERQVHMLHRLRQEGGINERPLLVWELSHGQDCHPAARPE